MKPLLDHSELVAFFEQQDPDGEYDYADNHNCPVCQYLKFKGISNPRAGPGYWRVRGVPGDHPIDDELEDCLNEVPYTYGALAARLRAVELE